MSVPRSGDGSLAALAGELEQAQFTVAFRGYEPREVRDLLSRAATTLREATERSGDPSSARTSAAAQAQRTLEAARSELVAALDARVADLAALPGQQQVLRRLTEEVSSMFQAVQRAADEAVAVAARELASARRERERVQQSLRAVQQLEAAVESQLEAVARDIRQSGSRIRELRAQLAIDEDSLFATEGEG